MIEFISQHWMGAENYSGHRENKIINGLRILISGSSHVCRDTRHMLIKKGILIQVYFFCGKYFFFLFLKICNFILHLFHCMNLWNFLGLWFSFLVIWLNSVTPSYTHSLAFSSVVYFCTFLFFILTFFGGQNELKKFIACG